MTSVLRGLFLGSLTLVAACGNTEVRPRTVAAHVAPAQSAREPHANAVRQPHDDEGFPAAVLRFAKAWDAADWVTIDAFLEPEQGFWLIYNASVLPYPYHYDTVSDAVQESLKTNIGRVAALRFDCTPEPGPAPDLLNCNSEGETFSRCKFGKGRPVLHEAFDLYLETGIAANEPDERRWAEQSRERATVLEGGGLMFLSAARGAVLSFAKRRGSWRLVAINTADCSA